MVKKRTKKKTIKRKPRRIKEPDFKDKMKSSAAFVRKRIKKDVCKICTKKAMCKVCTDRSKKFGKMDIDHSKLFNLKKKKKP